MDKAEKIMMQHGYNTLNSNCYSFSANVMLLAIENLIARPTLDSSGVGNIIAVIDKNTSVLGIRNNAPVLDKLMSLCLSIKKRLNSNGNHSEHDKKLLSQVSGIINKLDKDQYLEQPTFGY